MFLLPDSRTPGKMVEHLLGANQAGGQGWGEVTLGPSLSPQPKCILPKVKGCRLPSCLGVF